MRDSTTARLETAMGRLVIGVLVVVVAAVILRI